MARSYIRWVPSKPVMKWIGELHVRAYRWTGGRLGGFMDGLHVLLLTTTGRRSGAPRTVPLPYFRDGDDLLLVASYGGSDTHPAWFLNLTENPKVRVQVRRRDLEVEAHAATGEDRLRRWQGITRDHPRYAEYQKKTEREMPVVVLPGAGRPAG